METQVRNPQSIFMHPQRLIVPLFQRPYVWNEEQQWEPLWNDVIRVTEKLVRNPLEKPQPHFLGAVVLQQVQNPVGTMQARTIIDGQQRLTTLQLLFAALHRELMAVGAKRPALRLEALVLNAESFCREPSDRFKVCPTNRDLPTFNAVIGSTATDKPSLGSEDDRMINAHRFFAEQARAWLAADGLDRSETRAEAIETAVRELLQMVVIDLGVDENAQEIFETLNARGTQLTAADLIKNFIFQKLLESGADVEDGYERHWRDFESAFWETEISLGRLRYARSSVFLNHWLIAQTGEEVLAREVFSRFKRFAIESDEPMPILLSKLDRAARIYRGFVEAGARLAGSIDQLGLFAYRTSVLESEVIKPLVLHLLDPEQAPVPSVQLAKAFSAVESWMVRRMLVRATTKSYSQLVAELITHLRRHGRANAGDAVEAFLAAQSGDSRYWPDDDEVRAELRRLPAYRKLGKGRLRMVLEAVEDHHRGWKGDQPGLGEERVARGTLSIEHIMPRSWSRHWPLTADVASDAERDAIIHTIGNLTLLRSRLNAKVSDGPWLGERGKRCGLENHSVLFLNRNLLRSAGDAWTDSTIRSRSDELAGAIVEIWPAPAGHRSGVMARPTRRQHKVDLADLISAGCLQPGIQLFPRRSKTADAVVTLLSDGRIDIAGVVHSSPSVAAKAIGGRVANGWWFFLVDREKGRSLKDVRLEYQESIAAELDYDDPDDTES